MSGGGRTDSAPGSFRVKMCFWVELYMLFVLHHYYETNIIFFVFVDLQRKMFAFPQLSPISLIVQQIIGPDLLFQDTMQHK